MPKHDKKNLKKKPVASSAKPSKKAKPVHKASTPPKTKKKVLAAKPEIKSKAKPTATKPTKTPTEKKSPIKFEKSIPHKSAASSTTSSLKPAQKQVQGHKTEKKDAKTPPRTFAEISAKKPDLAADLAKKNAKKSPAEMPEKISKEGPKLKGKEKEEAQPKQAEPVALRKPIKVKKAELPAPEILSEPIDFSQLDDEITDEIVLTDAEGRRYCRTKDCDQLSSVEGYCRYHYLLYWKKIQLRKKILVDGKLEKYVEDLTSRYPDKYIEMLRRDLKTEKDFMSAVQELEIDDSGVESDMEEEAEGIIDEVRGITRPSGREDDDF
jgi:hypothetical protein